MLALNNQRSLQLSLYGGIALIVVSMLFLGQGLESSSFVGQAMVVLGVPAFFYVVGILVYRYLTAPLAAPGIIATGAWLVGVGLIHLFGKRDLLPDILQPYYWLGASLVAGVLITLTGHRVRTWLLVPLVPLVQVNAVWASMTALGIPVRWMPALTFGLVVLWWELPTFSAQVDARWRSVYRISGAILTVFVLIFSVWLPASTPQSVMITWIIGAVVIAVVGLQHRLVILAPVTVILLTCASLWGLPPSWWPPVWLLLAAGTVILLEGLTTNRKNGEKVMVVELSKALAIELSGAAALYAQLTPLLHVPFHPLGIIVVLSSASLLLIWIGLRRELLTATHAGLWLLLAAWVNLYFVAAPSSGLYGLWLALFAVYMLLIQRLLASLSKDKRKSSQTLVEAMTKWPAADLTLGVSTIALIWTAINISAAPTWIVTLTFGVIVGIWIAAGLIYRLPILLHLALWVAPIPYVLLLILIAPAFWTLPLLGIAWQLLGVGLLVVGHLSPRYRPAILAPLFIVGYALLGFGFTLAIGTPGLTPISLTILVVASMGTSLATIAGYHPAWDSLVEWIAPPDKRPYAYKHIRHLFLFLSAWLAAIWLYLMLSYTGMPLPRQGSSLVIFACLWFALGKLLTRFPTVVGWPVIGAGWLMWLIGLLEVFFSPPEAIVTIVIGLAISGEALRRSKEVYWLPVFLIQVVFTGLQAARLLVLPPHVTLLLVAMLISFAGMLYERRAQKAGRIAVATGVLLAAGIWCVTLDLDVMLGLTVLSIAAVLTYRDWRLVGLVYVSSFLLAAQTHVYLNSYGLLGVGVIQWIIGAELFRALRPRRSRTLSDALMLESDWATPFLWVGMLFSGAAVFGLVPNSDLPMMVASILLAAGLAVYANRLLIASLTYLSLLMVGVALLGIIQGLINNPTIGFDQSLPVLAASMTLAAILIHRLCIAALVKSPFPRTWRVLWIKPLMMATFALSSISVAIVLTLNSVYTISPLLLTVNCGLLAVFAVSIYAHRRQIIWLWTAIGLALISWTAIIGPIQSQSMLWTLLPLGALLLALGKTIQHPQHRVLEYAGSLIWVIGSVMELNPSRPLAPALLICVIDVACLTAYGYLFGRRIPFVSGVVMLGGGCILGVGKLNIWLLPFIGGMILLSGTLLLEIRREATSRWYLGWITRWQHWKW